MNKLFLLFFLMASNVIAAPIINLQYQEHNLTGKDVLLDATASYDNTGMGINYAWELISRPENSQTQIKQADYGIISLKTDRSGIYSLALRVTSDNGEEAKRYFSVYASQSNGEIVYGPITRSVGILCKLTLKLFGCDAELFNFNLTTVDESYSLLMSSKSIDRGIVTINNEQFVNYIDHTGALSEQFVKEITLQNVNNVSIEMVGNSLNSEYTFSIAKQNLPVDKNNQPSGSDISLLAPFDTPVTHQVLGEDQDGDQLFYKIIKQPKYGSIELTFDGNLTYTAGEFDGKEDLALISIYDVAMPSKEKIIEAKFLITTNQPPIILAQNMSSNTEVVSQIVTIMDDPPQTLTKTISRMPTSGTLTFDINTHEIVYTPNIGFSGTDSFELKVVDDGAFNLETTKEILVNVMPNTLPTISGPTNLDVMENSSVSFNLNATDADAGQLLSFYISQNPTNGTIQDLGNQNFIYTPNPNYSGSDSVIFELKDTARPEGVVSISYNLNVIETGNQPPAFNGTIDFLARNHGLPAITEMFLSEIPQDSDGFITKYVFNYGDGNTREIFLDVLGQDPNGYHHHFYQNAGTYTVQVEIFDNEGSSKIYSQDIVVQGGKAPAVKVIPSSISGTAPLTVNFDGTGTHDYGETPRSEMFFFWDLAGEYRWGQGLDTVSRTFDTPGVYEVFYDFQDGFHRTGGSLKIFVDSPAEPIKPQALISVDVSSGDAPLTVNFDATESINGDGQTTGLSYFWDFNDPYSGDGLDDIPTISHTFSKPGTYNVKLVVTNANGESEERFHTIYVTNPNLSEFDFYILGKNGNQIDGSFSLYSESLPLSEYSVTVDWGDGSKEIVYGQWFSHFYENTGTYTIAVTTELISGEQITKAKTIVVEDHVGFPFADLHNLGHFKVPFTNNYSLQNPTYTNVIDVDWFTGKGGVIKGDTVTHSDININHTSKGISVIKPALTNEYGLTFFHEAKVQAHEVEPVLTNFYVDKCVGKAPLTVNFSGWVASHSSGITNYFIHHFGEQKLFMSPEHSITLNTPGDHYMEFLAKSMVGEVGFNFMNFIVNDQDEPAGNIAPTISYSYGFNDPTNPLLMEMELGSSMDPDGRIACYEVIFNGLNSVTTHGYFQFEFPVLDQPYNATIVAYDNWGKASYENFIITAGQNQERPLNEVRAQQIQKTNSLLNSKKKRNSQFVKYIKSQKKI